MISLWRLPSTNQLWFSLATRSMVLKSFRSARNRNLFQDSRQMNTSENMIELKEMNVQPNNVIETVVPGRPSSQMIFTQLRWQNHLLGFIQELNQNKENLLGLRKKRNRVQRGPGKTLLCYFQHSGLYKPTRLLFHELKQKILGRDFSWSLGVVLGPNLDKSFLQILNKHMEASFRA